MKPYVKTRTLIGLAIGVVLVFISFVINFDKGYAYEDWRPCQQSDSFMSTLKKYLGFESKRQEQEPHMDTTDDINNKELVTPENKEKEQGDKQNKDI